LLDVSRQLFLASVSGKQRCSVYSMLTRVKRGKYVIREPRKPMWRRWSLFPCTRLHCQTTDTDRLPHRVLCLYLSSFRLYLLHSQKDGQAELIIITFVGFGSQEGWNRWISTDIKTYTTNSKTVSIHQLSDESQSATEFSAASLVQSINQIGKMW